MTEEQGEWLECVVDDDYLIWSEYPYPIKKKGNDRIIKEKANNEGYICCSLNCKTYKKHRIIGFQFIDNDDPEHKTQIDHINHNRADNRIENLRWVSASENMKNRAGLNGHTYTYLDELPETAEPLDAYDGYEFDGLWIDNVNQKLYLFNGVKYRELVSTRKRGNICYNVWDIENKQRKLLHKVLFG